MQCVFFWLAASFLAGVLAHSFFLAGVPAVLAALWLLFLSRGRTLFLPALCISWFLLGSLCAQADSFRPYEAVERHAAFGAPQKLTGVLVSGPDWKIQGRRKTCSFVVESEKLAERPVSGKVQVFLFNPGKSPGPGDRVEIYAEFKKPEPVKGFDYPGHLRSKGITALVQGAGWKSLRVTEKGKRGPRLFIFELRGNLDRAISAAMPAGPAALARALVLGMRGGLDARLREDFFKTGTSQVLATASRRILGSAFASGITVETISQTP